VAIRDGQSYLRLYTVTNTDGDTVQIPIAVNNERRNKGKFITDFGGAIKAEYPELARLSSAFVSPPASWTSRCALPIPAILNRIRQPQCRMPNADVVITTTPIINSGTSTYEVQPTAFSAMAWRSSIPH